MIQLSGVDLWHITNELRTTLVDSKLDQIYQYDAQTLLLRFHKTGMGKKEVHIHVPRALFETAKKQPVAKHLSFCSYLRKTIKGTYLTDVGMCGFSRVAYFTFLFKETSYTLFCEFYDKGNIILCTKDEGGTFTIDLPAQMQKWSNRIIQKGQEYTQETSVLPYELDEAYFTETLTNAKETNTPLSKCIATSYKLGGFYAKYVLKKLELTDESSYEELLFGSLQKALRELFDTKHPDYSPRLYLKNGDDIKTATTVCAFDVKLDKPFIAQQSLSVLLDSYYTLEETAEYEDAKTRAYDAKVQKLKRIITAQDKVFKKLSKAIDENESIANKLQEHAYESDVVIQNYRKNKSSECIVDEDKKNKTITVELQ